MSKGEKAVKRIPFLSIPIIKAESETQTSGHLVSRSPEKPKLIEMEEEQKMNIRKRRNLSKNRVQAARQREKTPEPGRTPIHEDTTSDDEDVKHSRNSREIEADNTYEEMKRLVQEKVNVKDPVYDLDTDDVLEARAQAANERRRRSISPFALPDKEELCNLERRGSFIDPTNKLLSANYSVTLKDEDSNRRNSLSEPPKDRRNSLTPPISSSGSPLEKMFPYPLPTTPRKLEPMVYPDENSENAQEDKPRKLKTPLAKENVLTLEDQEQKENKVTAKIPAAKPSEIPPQLGEIVTKVIQVERTPSRKLTQENRPLVEVRERIVRTPSKKLSADDRPTVVKQQLKPTREDPQTKQPPVKPARSKSATRLGNKTSESEMSEDQANQQNLGAAAKRKIVPAPRRFVKNRSPRVNRSQSVARIEEVKVVDKAGTKLTQTSREILELMQNRARSLSIPKDDPRLPQEYKNYSKTLQTPNKTPVSRTSRGISCPKTIQIISDREILSGLSTNKRLEIEKRKSKMQISGYIEASQSEYTSSCYSSSPSENDYDFDLSERTAELTRKLNLLSQEGEKQDFAEDMVLPTNGELLGEIETKTILRKRSITNVKNNVHRNRHDSLEIKTNAKIEQIKDTARSRWKLLANWKQFKEDNKVAYDSIILLRNKCTCELLILVIMFGLGGMMFRNLEGAFENTYKCGTRGVKRDFIESLWRGSHYLREEDWKSMARKKLFEFENQLHTAHEAGVTSYSGQRSWNFMNSFVYCMTLVTTIGYGHIAPTTFYGRVATIVYAVIGIPLFLIVLADFGKLFTRIIKFFWSFIRRFYYTRSCRKVRRTVPVQEVMKGLNVMYDVVRRPSQIFSEEEMQDNVEGIHPPILQRKPSDGPPPLPPKPGTVISKDPDDETEPNTPAPSVFEIDDEFNLPISVAIIILVIYIICGAVVYSIWEKWNFFESFYFVFISMSTIGLGDLVPDHPIFMMCSILYLVFGLALTSMCINVVQLKLSNTFKQASAKLGATIGLKVAEEDGSLVPETPPATEIAPVHKPKALKEDSKSKDDKDNDSKNR